MCIYLEDFVLLTRATTVVLIPRHYISFFSGHFTTDRVKYVLFFHDACNCYTLWHVVDEVLKEGFWGTSMPLMGLTIDYLICMLIL